GEDVVLHARGDLPLLILAFQRVAQHPFEAGRIEVRLQNVVGGTIGYRAVIERLVQGVANNDDGCAAIASYCSAQQFTHARWAALTLEKNDVVLIRKNTGERFGGLIAPANQVRAIADRGSQMGDNTVL